MGRGMDLTEALAHAPGARTVPEWVIKRAREEMPAYLWIDDEGRTRWCRCERCESAWVETKTGGKWPQKLLQGECVRCPRCRMSVTAKHLSRGWRNTRDRLKLVWYEKSRTEPGAVCAFGAWCERDFSYGDRDRPWTLDPEVDVRCFAVLRWGDDGYRFRTRWIDGAWRFVALKAVGHMVFGDNTGPRNLYCDPVQTVLWEDTLTEALEGTPFGRAWHDGYLMSDRGFDGVEALTWIARFPCVEYMTKLGMTDFLPEKLLGTLPGRLVNWRGGGMAEIFRLTPGQLGELKHAGITLTPALLTVIKVMEAAGFRLPAPALENIAELAERTTTTERIPMRLAQMLELHQPSRRRKALKYMANQADRHGDTRMSLGVFADYWEHMRELGEDLNGPAAFPADVRQAEARLIERIRRERKAADTADRAQRDEMIARRLGERTKQYGFSFGGLTLRPAKDTAEVIREGKVLHHCVAGYVGRYAAGEITLCVLRRDADPDMPWRTVEIKDGRVIQDRGYHNDVKDFGIPLTDKYRAALDCFWSAWRERNKVIA